MDTLDSLILIPVNEERYVDQCIPVDGGSYLAAARVRARNDRYGDSAVETGPSSAILAIAAFSNAECLGDALGEQATELELTVGASWQTIVARLTSAPGSRGIRMRVALLPEPGAGVGGEDNRRLQWDNLLLLPD